MNISDKELIINNNDMDRSLSKYDTELVEGDNSSDMTNEIDIIVTKDSDSDYNTVKGISKNILYEKNSDVTVFDILSKLGKSAYTNYTSEIIDESLDLLTSGGAYNLKNELIEKASTKATTTQYGIVKIGESLVNGDNGDEPLEVYKIDGGIYSI